MPNLLRDEAALEVTHHRLAMRLPHLKVLGRAEEVGIERGALDAILRVEEAATETVAPARSRPLGVVTLL